MQEIVSKTQDLYRAAFAKCLPLLEMSPQQQVNSIMPLFVANSLLISSTVLVLLNVTDVIMSQPNQAILENT